MGTVFSELKRKVLLRFGSKVDGQTELAVIEAINEAHKVIASIKDFDELMTLDTTHAFTVISQKLYHIETDLALVRPKDIYSIRYIDGVNSRKLIFVPFRQLDEKIPYTEQFAIGRPSFYTQRGMYIELFRIPDAVKSLYIQHSQWPAVLTNPTDQTPYLDIDHVIIALSIDMAAAIIEGSSGSTDWPSRAKQLFGVALSEEDTRPDVTFIAQPFRTEEQRFSGEPWNDAFVKKYP